MIKWKSQIQKLEGQHMEYGVSPDYNEIKIKIIVLHSVSEMHVSTTLYIQKTTKLFT